MSKFEQYNIGLKGLPDGITMKEFVLDDEFFKKIDSPEVQKGNVKAVVKVRKQNDVFEFLFELKGIILIPCDRCLDDMEQLIDYKESLSVKLGETFSEEDEIVIVPESEGAINIAWFLYEFIILNIPIKHVHLVGQCNKTMISKLRRHISHRKGDDGDDNALLEIEEDEEDTIEEEISDPRWDTLKDISENN